MKGLRRVVLACLALAIVLCAGGAMYLTATEYLPAPVERAARLSVAQGDAAPRTMRIVSWNTGYGGLGAESDFFMDGGSGVLSDAETVTENVRGISAALLGLDADAILLQEVDIDSHRSGNVNQAAAYLEDFSWNSAFALNYKCDFVPYPVPMLGKVESGLMTLTKCAVSRAERVALPCPFSWPMRAANLKRCLLVSYLPIEGTDKQLVLVDLHLEAYDDGEGKIAQTQALWRLLEDEYAKGNYVIAGGDFNQRFPGTDGIYPITRSENWKPGALSEDIPAGWRYAFDASAPTCRLLDGPYDADNALSQLYVIDGFLLSPNVELLSCETVDEGFLNTDHNPVVLDVMLMEEDA